MTATEVIALLGLQPHPEGGAFVETFRASSDVVASDGRRRSAGTAIYFLLREGDFSAWHVVASDEGWHHYAGAPLELHLLDETGHRMHLLGSNLTAGQRPQFVVPAGLFQAARPVGGWSLVGCTVAPGFDFVDFEMPGGEALAARWPEYGAIIDEFSR